MKFEHYSNLVLAKTTGANIHKITGWLVHIGLEWARIIDLKSKGLKDTHPEFIECVKDRMSKIGQATGVWTDFDTLEM